MQHKIKLGNECKTLRYFATFRASGCPRREVSNRNSRVSSSIASSSSSAYSASQTRGRSSTAAKSASSGTATSSTFPSTFRQPDVRWLRWGFTLHAAVPRTISGILLPDTQHDRSTARSLRAGRFCAATRRFLRRSKPICCPARPYSVILVETTTQHSELLHQKWWQQGKAAATATTAFTFTSRGR